MNYAQRTMSKEMLTDAEIARFWSKVETGSARKCWIWKGGKNRGYGAFWVGRLGNNVQAPRVAFALKFGEARAGAMVCHRCDNPRCCNPDHLFQGTNQDNMRDASYKGRTLQGRKHPLAKLTEDDVRAIRKARAQGVPVLELHRKYGVTWSLISRIALRQSWTHVE